MTSTPRIAILGAGPVGLEAALAASEGGLPFVLYEAEPRVAGHIRRWAHVRLFTPWRENVSSRMRRALEKDGWTAPDPATYPTGAALVEGLLEPLSRLPEVAAGLRTGTRVVGVGRKGMVKSDAIGSPRRGTEPFRILLETLAGEEVVEEADVVLDCTGSYALPNSLGDGGIPAPGERATEEGILREIPDLERDHGQWEGLRILLVGGGHSAQTAARDLAALAEAGGDIRVLWAVRSEDPDWGAVPEDPLPERAALVRRARELRAGESPGVEVRTGVVVESVRKCGEALRVGLRPRFDPAAGSGSETVEVEVDRIVSLTGSVGDHSLYRQLQVHECYATSGPMKLAAALLGSDSVDCLAQTGHGPESLVNPEPGFFILGSKSYGRNNTFLLRVGWEQVDDVFRLLE